MPAADSLRRAMERSDAGEAAADLDLAACWRALGQPVPESVALARALERGLPEADAASARARLDALGGPPAPVPPPEAPATDRPPEAAAAASADAPEASESEALAAYLLAGASIAGLIAGTATGLAALHEHAQGEHDLSADTLELELTVSAGVCLGVGLAAGIAALLLWPDGEAGPTAGPGDVGLGWEVRF